MTKEKYVLGFFGITDFWRDSTRLLCAQSTPVPTVSHIRKQHNSSPFLLTYSADAHIRPYDNFGIFLTMTLRVGLFVSLSNLPYCANFLVFLVILLLVSNNKMESPARKRF